MLRNYYNFTEIEKYLSYIDEIYINITLEQEFIIKLTQADLKNHYDIIQAKLVAHIVKQLDYINDPSFLVIAFFIYRSIMKIKMYEPKFKSIETIYFRVFNMLFFLVNNNIKKNSVFMLESIEKRAIKSIINSGYTFFHNFSEYNRTIDGSDEAQKEFFKDIDDVSNIAGDMHSYKFQNAEIIEVVTSKGISWKQLSTLALKEIKESFITTAELQNISQWNMVSIILNFSIIDDDIIIIRASDYLNLDNRLRNFIDTFEAIKAKAYDDEETELIFAYKSQEYYFISKKLVLDTQTAIETFMTWGQYGDLTKYYFGKSVNQAILKDYNKMMTYKVADVLVSSGYELPNQKVKTKKFPLIEISNYICTGDENIGDIDIIFYSHKTNVLYLVEYKNYQMLVSRKNDLSAEISKVQREGTIDKVKKRHSYVKENLEYCTNMIFKSKVFVSEVKSIILTTKPSYYFYKFKDSDYTYMDWITFKFKVEKNEF